MGLSRQEYWTGLQFPPPGSLPEPGIEPASLVSLALACMVFTISKTREAILLLYLYIILRIIYLKTLLIIHKMIFVPLGMEICHQRQKLLKYWKPREITKVSLKRKVISFKKKSYLFFKKCMYQVIIMAEILRKKQDRRECFQIGIGDII